MFFRRNAPGNASENSLRQAVAQALPGGDDTTREIVTAVVGLFGCISYADSEFSDRERHLVRNLLQTIDGITPASADTLLDLLAREIVSISSTEVPRFTRSLVQHGEQELRVSVLDMLLDIAAVDHDISHEEVTFLRQVTNALGLHQSDYNALQVKHRSKLRALKFDQIDGPLDSDAEGSALPSGPESSR